MNNNLEHMTRVGYKDYFVDRKTGKWYYYDHYRGAFGLCPTDQFKGKEHLFRVD